MIYRRDNPLNISEHSAVDVWY